MVDRFRRGEPAFDPPDVLPWENTPTPDNFMGGNLRGILEGLGCTRYIYGATFC